MKELHLFLGYNVLIAAWHAGSATFAIVLAIKPVACHAAILQVAECNRVLAAKSLPNFQCQGRCLMHLLMTYTHLCVS